MNNIENNFNLKFIISDVDETIAGVYMDAHINMINVLNKMLSKNIAMFLISGQSFENIDTRIVNKINKKLRKKILVGACSGAEVWGYSKLGDRLLKPYYNKRKCLTNEQMILWREIIDNVIEKFGLDVHDVMPKKDFIIVSKGYEKSIMLEDRNSQITMEIINGLKKRNKYNGKSLREAIIEYSNRKLREGNLPIKAQKAGTFAIDFVLSGVSKATAVKYVLENEFVLNSIGIRDKLNFELEVEVWGDKFSLINGGTDMSILYNLPKSVRAIDFRKEDIAELDTNYNIVIWNGRYELHNGLAEYIEGWCKGYEAKR